MTAGPDSCPLCNQPPEFKDLIPDGSFNIQVICKRCGRFVISYDALTYLNSENQYLLSAVCRLWPEKRPPLILPSNIQQLIERAPQFTVSEKLDTLLQLIASRSPQLSGGATLDVNVEYPLLVARSSNEAAFLVNGLVARRLIVDSGSTLVVTLEGWERLDAIRQSGRQSDFVFVAMWFDVSTNQLYDDAIRPAIRSCGYEPLRIDRHEHVNRIDDEIVGQIKRSRFMVADFTGQRHGVYFEAGLMMGLGRNVIWLCEQSELQANKLHFDVRQYNFIDWTSPEDARTRLQQRILALEGEGPRKPA